MSTSLPWLQDQPDGLRDLPEGRLDAAARILRDAAGAGQRIVLAGHIGPDADALGSVLALHEVLQGLGARSLPVIGESPLSVPANLAWLPHATRLVGADALPDRDELEILVTLDAASPDRLGAVTALLDGPATVVMVDHHASGQPFGDLALVAPGAASTTQVLAALIARMGVALTPSMATCLYAGLVADTGRFGYSSSDGSTLRLAGELVDAGADHVQVHRRLFATRTLAELDLLAAALGRLRFLPEHRLVHTHVTARELAASGANGEATEHLVDVVRWADVAEVTLVAKPGPDDTWRVSLRSEGGVDVGRLAGRFGGGGHQRAAGFTRAGQVKDVVAEVVAALGER